MSEGSLQEFNFWHAVKRLAHEEDEEEEVVVKYSLSSNDPWILKNYQAISLIEQQQEQEQDKEVQQKQWE